MSTNNKKNEQASNDLTDKKILSLKKNDLERECNKKGLSIDGNKYDLQVRLLRLNMKNSPSKVVTNLLEEYRCPITLELPWDPVTAGDGRVYERSAIEEYFETCKKNRQPVTSPTTREPMSTVLLLAPQVRNLIQTAIDSGAKGEITNMWMDKMKAQKEADDLLKQANDGDGYAMYVVGVGYLYGNNGFIKDDNESYLWCKKSHKAGNTMGTVMLGYCLCNGIGGEQSIPYGIMYLTSAAKDGSNLAAYYLGYALAKGLYGFDVNKPDAIEWLKKCLDDNCRYQHLSKEKAQKFLDELTAEE